MLKHCYTFNDFSALLYFLNCRGKLGLIDLPTGIFVTFNLFTRKKNSNLDWGRSGNSVIKSLLQSVCCKVNWRRSTERMLAEIKTEIQSINSAKFISKNTAVFFHVLLFLLFVLVCERMRVYSCLFVNTWECILQTAYLYLATEELDRRKNERKHHTTMMYALCVRACERSVV